MPVTSFAGSVFTVKVGSTTYTAQITRGGVSTAPSKTKTKTLGPNTATTKTDVQDSATFDFLYDGDSGFYKALWDDAHDLDSAGLTVEIHGGGGEWNGTMSVDDLGIEFPAEGETTCTASFSCDSDPLDFDTETP